MTKQRYKPKDQFKHLQYEFKILDNDILINGKSLADLYHLERLSGIESEEGIKYVTYTYFPSGAITKIPYFILKVVFKDNRVMSYIVNIDSLSKYTLPMASVC